MDISKEVTLIVIGCAFFLLVAIGIIILILVYQKKQLRFIFEKKALESLYKEEILKSRVEAQEDTLNYVSKEIHDNIGQLVNSAKLLIGTAERKMPHVGNTLQQADQTLSKTIHELRALSKSLNRQWLEQFNFFENLQDETHRINASGTLTMTVAHSGELTLSKEHQLILFRMVQEAFQNSVKHGAATHIHVKAEQQETKLAITIDDNGKGFDVNDSSKQGFGIFSLKHRVSLIGGAVQWRSDEKGTRVTIEIPHQ
jgi:signal transduction histidine kinase